MSIYFKSTLFVNCAFFFILLSYKFNLSLSCFSLHFIDLIKIFIKLLKNNIMSNSKISRFLKRLI